MIQNAFMHFLLMSINLIIKVCLLENSFFRIRWPINNSKAFFFNHRLKITRSNKKNKTPYGGIIPILFKIKEFGIPQVIRSVLGTRKKQSRYGYEDVLIAWVLTSLTGGKSLDSITDRKAKLNIIKGLKLPSHDTLGRVMKNLATTTLVNENVTKKKQATITYTNYNDNILLNRMLIKATKRIGVLKPGLKYTLDIDATFLETKCRGAESRHETNGKTGFAPMVCLIKDLPVYISLRNGDAGARFMLKESLENCLNLLEESNIKIGRVISDAAGYSLAVSEMLEKRGIKFVMRFPVQARMSFNKHLENANWRKTEIQTATDVWDGEIADINYRMYYPKHKEQTMLMRVVAFRLPDNKNTSSQNLTIDEKIQTKKVRNTMRKLSESKRLKQPKKKYVDIHWKKIGGYTYKFYVTNDFKKSSEDIIIEYNKRGDAERKFSFLKNELAWRWPPFQWMNENNVFLICSALANNIFVGIVRLFRQKIPHRLNKNIRLDSFVEEFVIVVCEYIKKTYVFSNTDIEYELLI